METALSSVKGIYIISDKHNGKHYVGSACGHMGIWSRWLYYIESGHGGNAELARLIREKTLTYARNNFRFSLVEIMSMSVDDESVLARESHWKKVLLSKEHGYNAN